MKELTLAVLYLMVGTAIIKFGNAETYPLAFLALCGCNFLMPRFLRFWTCFCRGAMIVMLMPVLILGELQYTNNGQSQLALNLSGFVLSSALGIWYAFRCYRNEKRCIERLPIKHAIGYIRFVYEFILMTNSYRAEILLHDLSVAIDRYVNRHGKFPAVVVSWGKRVKKLPGFYLKNPGFEDPTAALILRLNAGGEGDLIAVHQDKSPETVWSLRMAAVVAQAGPDQRRFEYWRSLQRKRL